MNEKLEMAKNSLYNVNEIKDIKENPVVESVLLAPIKAIPVLGDLTTVARIPSPIGDGMNCIFEHICSNS